MQVGSTACIAIPVSPVPRLWIRMEVLPVFRRWVSVDSICRGSADTQYMPNFSKSPKQLTYKPL